MASDDVFYNAVLKLVYEGGSVVREAYNRPAKSTNVMTKSSAIDLVTETDQKVEELLIKGLSAQFPDHKFIGEESVAGGQKIELTDAPTWIIDPIDGTTNFVHRLENFGLEQKEGVVLESGLPFIGICIALYIKKEPRIGIVYNPILDELYSARNGRGAYKNGFPIHASGTTDINHSIFMSTIGSSRAEHVVQNFLNNFRKVMCGGSQGHRSLGSAALNMCYVAAGGADAYLEYGLHCWDVAASALIIKEAGGCNIDPTGQSRKVYLLVTGDIAEGSLVSETFHLAHAKIANGAPFDLMARRILCAGSEQLARSISGIIENVDMPRD